MGVVFRINRRSHFFFFLVSAKIKTYESAFHFEDLVHHFDTTGLIIGLIGIVIGLITVIYVEKQNRYKDSLILEKDQVLQKAVNELQKATKRINSKLTNLSEIISVDDLIINVTALIKNAKEDSSKLFILSHLANFGQFLIRNVEIITRTSSFDPNNPKSVKGMLFFENYLKRYLDLKENLNNELKDFTKHNKLSMAVLTNRKLSPHKFNRLLPFIEDRILKGKRVIIINKNNDLDIDFGTYSKEDIFIHESQKNSVEGFNSDKQKNILIEDIIQNDEGLIDNLKATANTSRNQIEIKTLDYIPFQFFVSVPQNESLDTGWQAIIVFSNYYNLGYHGSVVSFMTENVALCRGLKKMYERLLDSQLKKDETINPIRKLFLGCNDIVVCLKNIEITDRKIVETIGFENVTPVPDILGKDHLLALLKEYEVKYISTAWHIKQSEINSVKNLIKNQKSNLFSLGLFYNPLSAYLSLLSPHEGNPLFKLIQKTNTAQKNKVRIAYDGTVNNPLFFEFYESYNDNDSSSNDYAVFVRLKIDRNWVFVGGGINFFGSQHLHLCIKEGAAIISDKVSENPFAVVFSIRKGISGPVIKLILLSLVINGEIKSKYEQIDIPNSIAS